ncbi:hypothetical protein DKX38_008755 [Salix brachista]|uniref:Serine aminopeptidase S33 domain-containing protein n=1 Tax=Salix brachista TaxID=2182728 RepID=A0A5N5M8Y1_9ROSI|nr:hypothetical protein DKX38_008755 [Salix brachista]
MKFCPRPSPPPTPPPPSPISSIRSSCCRRRTRSLPPSLVIQDTSKTAAAASDIDTDSLSVSRRLILLRHAKSSWDDRSLRDHDRPLSKSGVLDAAKVSQKLQQLGWIPQLILSSDALRTKQTLKIMQQQVPDFLDAEVHFISSFYSIAAMDGQTADHLQQAICNYSRDDILTVMCMGHNRGWEEAASMFSGASIELNTCNAALLEAAGKSWAEVKLAPFLFVPLVFISSVTFSFYGLEKCKIGKLHLLPRDQFEKTVSTSDPRNLLQYFGRMENNDVSLDTRETSRAVTKRKQFTGFHARVNGDAKPSRERIGVIRRIITQISIYGRRTSLLLVEHTRDKTWRQLANARGHTLRCSHYLPSPFPEDTPLPCVIYCHGNSGCRADANEAAVILLPSNITVFALDFSGSGLSDGDYVSLGWHERDDLKVVVSYLRSNKQISCIGLWGRSMGAVTSLLYGAEDPSIAGMVLDSAFANLFDLMMELVDVYKIRLPKFTIKMAVQYMRWVIQKKAKFDIMDLNCLKVAPKTFIPALFGHASEDKFIQPHHADLIFDSYAGDKNMIKFDGDHNSSRPQFFYDSVSIFFFNVLHPPQTSSSSNKLERYYDLGDLKVGAGMDESLLYEIITGLRSACTDTASSSVRPSIPTTKPVSELLSEVAPLANIADSMASENAGLCSDEPSNLQGKPNGQSEECCSYTSSNRESWGRCSSLGGSDEESPAECRAVDNSHEMTLKAFATPLRSIQQKSPAPAKEEEKKKKKALTVPKKLKGEKFEKLEAFSKRLRHCILRRVNHQRHRSS